MNLDSNSEQMYREKTRSHTENEMWKNRNGQQKNVSSHSKQNLDSKNSNYEHHLPWNSNDCWRQLNDIPVPLESSRTESSSEVIYSFSPPWRHSVTSLHLTWNPASRPKYLIFLSSNTARQAAGTSTFLVFTRSSFARTFMYCRLKIGISRTLFRVF